MATHEQQPQIATLHHAYAELSSVHLHYVTAGEGKLILFLHGFPQFWYAWKIQLLEFGRDYRVVAPDMRGYNLSSKPTEVEQYRLPHLVEDVRELAAHLGYTTFTLVGHDWGGAVAWAFALSYPEQLDKLIIINMAHPATFGRELRQNPAQQQASQYILLFRNPQAEEVLSANNYARFDERILQPGLRHGYFTEEDCQAYLEAWSQPGALTGGLNYYRAARIGPSTGAADDTTGNDATDSASLVVQVPTLVIWGEQDQALLTGNLDGLEDVVSHLTLRRIPDATHWVVHEKPDLVHAYMRDFLASPSSHTTV